MLINKNIYPKQHRNKNARVKAKEKNMNEKSVFILKTIFLLLLL